MSEDKNIEKDERFDELYRRSLGSLRVEPPARSWNRVSRLMLGKELVRLNFSNLPGYTWVIAAAIAVILGGGIYLFSTEDQSQTNPVPPETRTQSMSTPREQPDANPSDGKTSTPITKAETPATSTHAGTVAMKQGITEPESTVTTDLLSSGPAYLESRPATSAEYNLLTPMKPYPFEPFGPEQPTMEQAFQPVSNPKPRIAPPEVKTGIGSLPTSLSLGLSLTPDMVFYNNTSSYFKYDYTLDAGVQYDFGRFYLQSGVGVTWSSDIGSFAVSANKNDSVGYYYSVVSFAQKPGEPGMVEFTTSMSTVFDTNQYVYDYSSRNTYTYVNIPLVIGYRAVTRPLWSLGVDAGGFWSGLVSSSEPEPVFYIPEGRITSVENTTPVRRKNSFGLLGSIRFEYMFAKRFSVMVAPTFKYHLNTINEKDIPGSTQPWSIGLRAGIWYRIDLNK